MLNTRFLYSYSSTFKHFRDSRSDTQFRELLNESRVNAEPAVQNLERKEGVWLTMLRLIYTIAMS